MCLVSSIIFSRWWKDGTQVIVNQACEHEDKPGILVEGEGEACRGYALRGANCKLMEALCNMTCLINCPQSNPLLIISIWIVISKDPNDPNKTRITLLAHANPGGGLPQWVSYFSSSILLVEYLIFLMIISLIF